MNTNVQALNHLLLALSVELIGEVLVDVAGEEISTHIRGEEMYGSVLADTIATNLQSNLSVRTVS